MLLRPEAELVRLYEAWGKTDEAARFRGIVDAADYRERTGTAR